MTAYVLGPLLHEGKAKRVHATDREDRVAVEFKDDATAFNALKKAQLCLLYTSPSPRDRQKSRMPSSA